MKTLEQIIQEEIDKRNNTPVPEFDGLTPSEMHRMCYEPFHELNSLQLRQKIDEETLSAIPFFRLTEELLRIVVREGSIKLTPLGALPRKYLRELYALGIYKDEWVEKGIMKLFSEYEYRILPPVRYTAQFAGLLKVRLGKLSLTKLGKEVFEPTKRVELFGIVFETFMVNYDWSNDYGTEPDVAGQFGWLFSLLLLHRYGSEYRPASFYSDRYYSAFPRLLRDEDLESYPGSRHSKFIAKFLDHFGRWFGFTETQNDNRSIRDSRDLWRTTPLLPLVFVDGSIVGRDE